MEIITFAGGRSVEHAVSLSSERNIRSVLEENGHIVHPILIREDGVFTYQDKIVSFIPGKGFFVGNTHLSADVVFPLCHGYEGEDGALQGLCQFLHLPIISESVLASAIGMHKDAQTCLAKESKIPVLDNVCLDTTNTDMNQIQSALALGKDLIIKPEAGGSSIGVAIIKDATREKVAKAVQDIGLYDAKALIQPYLNPLRELECAVYAENGHFQVIGPGELCKIGDYASYTEKYTPTKAAMFNTDPVIPEEIRMQAQTLSLRIAKALYLTLYTRIDFFYHKGKLIFNEINTVPGMTEKSGFPLLADAKGKGINKVLEIMIKEAIALAKREEKINHHYA